MGAYPLSTGEKAIPYHANPLGAAGSLGNTPLRSVVGAATRVVWRGTSRRSENSARAEARGRAQTPRPHHGRWRFDRTRMGESSRAQAVLPERRLRTGAREHADPALV